MTLCLMIKYLAEHNIDGNTFIKLTRDDLKDIFPDNFKVRKLLWDFLEDLVRIYGVVIFITVIMTCTILACWTN